MLGSPLLPRERRTELPTTPSEQPTLPLTVLRLGPQTLRRWSGWAARWERGTSEPMGKRRKRLGT